MSGSSESFDDPQVQVEFNCYDLFQTVHWLRNALANPDRRAFVEENVESLERSAKLLAKVIEAARVEEPA
jgi:hypothetical protein